ncbi:MAG: hypothetical protein QOI48_4595 [Solirubrobacteraceae bacterium]|jgi:hypothetical protein|nr:hypothetical protein [Solirubrobacteraceae bacterium]
MTRQVAQRSEGRFFDGACVREGEQAAPADR